LQCRQTFPGNCTQLLIKRVFLDSVKENEWRKPEQALEEVL
jgi:hypothetical protein